MNPGSSGYAFDPLRGLVVVQAEVFGRLGSIVLRLALDTGATGTIINVGPLAAVGYDPSLQSERIQVTTGSGVEYAPRISVIRMKAIDREQRRLGLNKRSEEPLAGSAYVAKAGHQGTAERWLAPCS